MTTQPTQLSSESVYDLSSLRKTFSAVLRDKQDAVDDFNKKNPNATWAAAWPDGNSTSEKLVVDWLSAQAKSGAKQIITQDPISTGKLDAQNSLYMQIQSKRAYAA